MGWMWRLGAAAMILSTTVPAAAATVPQVPADVAVAAGRSMVVGNSVKVATPVGDPAPIASSGSVLLDERAEVGDVWASKAVKTKLLSTVLGDVIVPDGVVQLGPNSQVAGDVVARGGVVCGLDTAVAGGVVATAGNVRLARLAQVSGDVYAQGEFRADTDVVVGAAGTRLEIVGSGVIRDRSEYFATIVHEGPILFPGVGDPILHAPVVQVAPGTLVAPSLPAFHLGLPTLPVANPGTQDLEAARGAAPLVIAPGAWGRLALEQDSVAVLQAGDYVFASIEAASTARIVVQLAAAPATLSIAVARDARLGRRFTLDLGDADPVDAAARIVLRAGNDVRIDQDGVWVGTIQAAHLVQLGKNSTLTGAAWSAGDLQVGRDSTVTWVPSPALW